MPKKKLHFILFFASIFATLLFVSGCVEEVYVDELKRPDCDVRFIQADESYGSTTFRIYGRFEDSTKVVAEAVVDYANVSKYFTIPAGQRKVEFISSKGTATTTLTFTSYWQSTLTLRAGALSNSYERLVYSDEAYKIDTGRGTKGAVRFRNLMNAATYCSREGTYYFPTSTNYASGASTGYYNLDKGEHSFEIFAPNTNSPDIATIDTQIDGNTRYTLVAFGTLASPMLKIFKDDGK